MKKRLGITFKLTALFLAFGAIPMVIQMSLLWRTKVAAIEHSALQLSTVAADVAEQIDRNLLERTQDAQSFPLRGELADPVAWKAAGYRRDALVREMNALVRAHRFYALVLLVDPGGRLIATNEQGADGAPIATSGLYEKDFSVSEWFKRCKGQASAGEAPIVIVEDAHVDEDVRLAYPGAPGLTIGFSTPLRGLDGAIIGYWSNRLRFSSVEDVVAQAYRQAQQQFPGLDLSVVDKAGAVIAAFNREAPEVVENAEAFERRKLKSLVAAGVAPANLAVQGKTGFCWAEDAQGRRQGCGFAHLDGAGAFAGLGWSVIARASEADIARAAGIDRVDRAMLTSAAASVLAILTLGVLIGRRAVAPLLSLARVAQRAATGDIPETIDIRNKDEMGGLAESIRALLNAAKSAMTLQAVVENTPVTTLLADRELNITYVNPAGIRNLEKLQEHLPAPVETLVGRPIDLFQEQAGMRGILSDPRRLPHRERVRLGETIFDLLASPMYDRRGQYIGPMITLDDVTETLRLEAQAQQLIETAQRTEAELRRKVESLLETVAAAARGDLTRPITVSGDDAVGQLAQGLGQMIAGLKDLLRKVVEAVEQVSEGAAQVSASSQQLAEGASESASSLEQTAAALEQMTAMVRASAENASRAHELSGAARNAANDGAQIMSRMQTTMNGIGEASERISKIIKVIEEIAFQTNLLALNAAVEAARAGEHGKGFAVVAEEVRSLAQRSAQAAKETGELIANSVSRAREGAVVTSEAAQSLTQIVENIGRVADLVEQINSASHEQAQGIEQINCAILQLDRVTQSNAAGAEESASAAEEMNAQCLSLQQMCRPFKIDPDQESPLAPAEAASGRKRIAQGPSKARRTKDEADLASF